MNRKWALLALMGLLGAGLSPPPLRLGKGPPPTRPAFSLTLSTPKPVYRPGEPIAMQLDAVNNSALAVTLNFNSGQRYDFTIVDEKGKTVYRWARGRAFTMALGAETLGGAKSALTYRETYIGKLSPGRYTLIGKIVAKNLPLEAMLTFSVTPTGEPEQTPEAPAPLR